MIGMYEAQTKRKEECIRKSEVNSGVGCKGMKENRLGKVYRSDFDQ